MIKVQGTNSLEVDSARYYLQAILTLRDRFNEQSSLTLTAQGKDISVATCVLELLKKQFPSNKFTIETSGKVNEVKDCNETTMTITFQVIEFQKTTEQPFFYVQKYMQQLIEYEKKQPQPKEQKIEQQEQQQKKNKKNRIPKNYQADELEVDGLHGFAQVLQDNSDDDNKQNDRVKRRNQVKEYNLQRGAIRTRGQKRD